MPGHACNDSALRKTALPNRYRNPPLSLHWSCPSRCRPVFDSSNRVFLNSVAPCACFGRKKGVCDKLQRHPLINPLFRPHLSPFWWREVLSAPFARGNLRLVISYVIARALARSNLLFCKETASQSTLAVT